MSDATSDTAEPWWIRVLEFPLIAMVVAVAAFVVATYIAGLILSYNPPMDPVMADLTTVSLVIGMQIAVYKLVIRNLGDKPHDDLPIAGFVRQSIQGLGIGFLSFALVVAIAAILGVYRIAGSGSFDQLLPILLTFGILPAVQEEILFRGILFRWLEEFGGSWAALAITSALFGLAHILNPNATWFSSFTLALEAGLWFGGAYMLTRSLWLPIGMHAAWNFTQGGIFGLPVSGVDAKGAVVGELSGNVWLTGGPFGLEASVIALVLLTLSGIGFVIRAKRRGLVFGPMWTRPQALTFAEQKRL